MNRLTFESLPLADRIAKRLWPEEVRGGFYLDIVALADEAAIAGNRPQAIAAVLLYQQLVE